MGQSASFLAKLLHELDLSGKDIAAETGADETMISRWKTRQRKLTLHSRWLTPLAEYFVEYDRKQQRGVIARLLTQYGYAPQQMDAQQRQDALCGLLCENPTSTEHGVEKNAAREAAPEVFWGQTGMLRAVERCLRYARAASAQSGIILHEFDSADHINGDGVMPSCTDTLRVLANEGQRIQINMSMLPAGRNFSQFLDWPDLLLRPDFSFFCRRRTGGEPQEYALLIAEGECAVISCRRCGEVDNCRTELYTDAKSVEFFCTLARDHLIHAQPLIQTMPVHWLGQWLEFQQRDAVWGDRGTTYRQHPLPTMRSISEELLRDILTENQVPAAHIEECLTMRRQAVGMKNREVHSRELYDLESMQLAAEQGGYVDYELSSICGQQIAVSPAQFLRLLQQLRERRSEWVKWAIVPFSTLRASMRNLHIIVAAGKMLLLWEPHHYSLRVGSQLDSMTFAFFEYCESCWKQLDEQERQDAYQLAVLQRIEERVREQLVNSVAQFVDMPVIDE